MKVLYIDESGCPELSTQEPFVILSGVLIDEKDEEGYAFLMKRLKAKYRLEEERNLHAVDIFENIKARCYLGKTKKRTKNDKRKDFQKDIWSLIKDYGIDYTVVNVKKDIVRKIMGLQKQHDRGRAWIGGDELHAKIDRQLPMDVAINAIYYWAINKTKGSAVKLKIIFESRPGDMFTVRNHGYIADKDVFVNKLMRSFAENFKKFVVSIGFANKNVCSVGLELADLISYTCNVYFLQIQKNLKPIDNGLKKAIRFSGIHKTLNKNHYRQLNELAVRRYIPGFTPRTKRISKFYKFRPSLSPANAGSQVEGS